MKTYFKVVAFLVALLLAGQVGRAAEAARMQNYDQWKNLPSMVLFDKANGYWRIDKIDSALVCCVILSNRYNDKLSTAEKGICCGATVAAGIMSMHYFYDYQLAYRYLAKAEKISTDNQFGQQLTNVYGAMSSLQADKLNLETNYAYQPEILSLFKKTFHQAVKSRSHNQVCLSLINMSYDAMIHNHVPEIDDELNALCSMEIPDSIITKRYTQNLCKGITQYRVGNYQEALDIFTQLVCYLPTNASLLETARDRIMIHVFTYVALLALHRDKEALQELADAEQIAIDSQIDEGRVEMLKLLQDYHTTHGNEALAKEYKLKYFEAKDEFINRSKLLSVEQQKFLIELDEMGEEVKDLEAQKRVRDLVIAGVAIFALMVIGALIFLWRNYLSTKRRNLVLYQKNQELLALEQERNMPAEKYKSSPMDEQAKDELLQRIYAAMESHQEIYDEGFTLDQLARLVGDNPNYVSQVINEKKGCNFKAFVNDYKIKEACRRLSDKQQYGGLTIEAIGQSVGFKSRTHFYATFKQFTGMTPAAYQRAAQEKPDSPQ